MTAFKKIKIGGVKMDMDKIMNCIDELFNMSDYNTELDLKIEELSDLFAKKQQLREDIDTNYNLSGYNNMTVK